MNWYALLSYGWYAEETVTASQRAALFVSYGLLSSLPSDSAGGALKQGEKGLFQFSTGLKF